MDGDPNYPYAELRAFVPEAQFVPGDINGNGNVSVADAILALRSALGVIELSADQLAAGDVNGDGDLTTADAILILRISMGL